MIKKLVAAALFIFWAVVVSILTAGLLSYQNQNPAGQGGQSGNAAGQQTSGGAGAGVIVLTLDEISKHDSASDCWLVISSKVYDVTNFVGVHPGSPQTMLPYCGKQDATNAFATQDRGSSHSQQANSMLAAYYIGDLNQPYHGSAGGSSNQNGGQAGGTNQTARITLTASEIAKRNSAQSCWLLISGKVYDVTNFISVHPGGAGEILPYCGFDATTAFATKGGRGASHSATANGLLDSYFIGNINDTISQGEQQPPQNPPGAGSGGDDDGFEDEFEDD